MDVEALESAYARMDFDEADRILREGTEVALANIRRIDHMLFKLALLMNDYDKAERLAQALPNPASARDEIEQQRKQYASMRDWRHTDRKTEEGYNG